MTDVIKKISASFRRWAERSRPIGRGERIALAGMDCSNANRMIDDLFFYPGPDNVSRSFALSQPLQAHDHLDGGSLRNSFYPEIFLRHSAISRLWLDATIKGAATLQVSASQLGQPVRILNQKILTVPRGRPGDDVFTTSLPVPLRPGLPDGTRLFWRLQALQDEVEVEDIQWVTQAPRHSDARMLVALRTFGRTQDIVELLENFQAEAERSGAARYRHLLQNTFFLILDTSTGVAPEDYAPLAALSLLNFHAVSGANLGGGGNMSQIMRIFSRAFEAAQMVPDELLLLDDDLNLSLESLYRHWAATMFRTDSTIMTLPVLTKSEPRKMWEDGGFWGRFLGAASTGARTHIAPRLIRHNLMFYGPDHLDLMAVANYPEYCTFIFFSLPWKQFVKLGYPLALFLRGDDIEYSLRNRALAGGRLISNPNLIAWHEPAHSYGQEYMSICHGIMINMAYGQQRADKFVRFFHQQALRHASLHDTSGLTLYSTILRDLLAKNIFLEHGFARSYIAKLQEFKALDADYEYLPPEVVEGLRHTHNGNGKKLVEHPFIYMSVDGNDDIGAVLLFNPHTKCRRIYRYDDPAIMAAVAHAAAELYALIARFSAEFEDLRAHYVARLERSRHAAFWDEELALNPPPVDLGASTMDV